MLIILVIGFAICWFPLQLFNLIFWLFDDLRIPTSKTYYYIYVGTYFACHWLSTGFQLLILIFLTNFLYKTSEKYCL